MHLATIKKKQKKKFNPVLTFVLKKKVCECETRICKMKLTPEGYTFTHYQCLMAT